MKPEDIKPFDWLRIFAGEAPPSFFIEIILRTVFLFFLLLVSMRLLGRRFATQLSRIEVMSIFALAAAIGVPLQAPDRGVLPAFVIAAVTVALGRGIARLSARRQRIASFVEDDELLLVSDGVVLLDNLRRTRVTVELLFGELRQKGVRHLGEVERFYLEASGSFSLVRNPTPPPGLSVLPDIDPSFYDEQPQTTDTVCGFCGARPESPEPPRACPCCGKQQWMTGIR